jgi:hypothetical protein
MSLPHQVAEGAKHGVTILLIWTLQFPRAKSVLKVSTWWEENISKSITCDKAFSWYSWCQHFSPLIYFPESHLKLGTNNCPISKTYFLSSKHLMIVVNLPFLILVFTHGQEWLLHTIEHFSRTGYIHRKWGLILGGYFEKSS